MKIAVIFTVAIIAGAGLFLLLSSGKSQALDSNRCLTCHGNKDLQATNASGEKISLYVNENEVNSAAHRYIDCTTCHTGDFHNSDSPLTKLSLAEKCGSCHKTEYQQHLRSVHGQQLVQGNQDVATCVDCHSPGENPHNVIRVLEYSAPTYKKNIAQTCGKCHSDEKLMANYGIVEKVYESYMRSFHGKAMQLGTYEITQLETATCTNCHGTHDIMSTNDPNSPVAGLANLANTCEQCHAGAGLKFASGFLGHREASPGNIPIVHYIQMFFNALLTTVLSFGGVVVVAAMVRFSINRWRR